MTRALMKRSYSDLEHHGSDPPYGSYTGRTSRQPKQYQQQTEPGTGKIKACMQCGTTRTPQWREGPLGPKTLCNACGVKRVRAIKAMQQGKGASSPHGAGGKKKGATSAAAAAAARTESVELATTLQLLRGDIAAAPPPAKRARATQSAGGSTGRGKRGGSVLAMMAQQDMTDPLGFDPLDPAAAAALTAPGGIAAGVGATMQQALAALAAKGSVGGESNPTDSGEEISWSPNDHQQHGEAAAAAAVAEAGPGARRQRQHQPQHQQAMRAAAGAAGGAEHELLLPTLPGHAQASALEQPQHHVDAAADAGGLFSGYPAIVAADEDACGDDQDHEHAASHEEEEAAAVANLLSMSGAADQQAAAAAAAGPVPGSRAGSSGPGKTAMRELVAALTAGATGPSAATRSPSSRRGTRTPPPRHVVTVRQRGTSLGAAVAAAAAGASGLMEDGIMFLLGPGMHVLTSHVAPDELLEVIRLNEMASEAQRSRAAAEAAVEAVEQILRDKQAAAATAQSAARAAMQRLHHFVANLSLQHGLMHKAVQAVQEPPQQPTLVNRFAGSRIGSLTQLDILAASIQQQQQQHIKQEREQQHQTVPPLFKRSTPQQQQQQQHVEEGQQQQQEPPVQDDQQVASANAPAFLPEGAVAAECQAASLLDQIQQQQLQTEQAGEAVQQSEHAQKSSAPVEAVAAAEGLRGPARFTPPLAGSTNDDDAAAAAPSAEAEAAEATVAADDGEIEAAALLGSFHDLAAAAEAAAAAAAASPAIPPAVPVAAALPALELLSGTTAVL